MMIHVARRVVLALAACAATAVSHDSAAIKPSLADIDSVRQRALRSLGDSYATIDDLTGYQLIYGKCLRVKVPENNDDDAEGNSYFYNGRYYAQHMSFASFYLCTASSSTQCGKCDYTQEYVTDLKIFLKSGMNYLEDLCSSCKKKCGYRNLAADDVNGDDHVDDAVNNYFQNGGGGGYSSMTCSTCKQTCSTVQTDDAQPNEKDFLQCQAAFKDDTGVQYYSGPSCKNGVPEIGLYYDENCLIGSSVTIDYGFAYGTFGSLVQACFDCASGTCDKLYQQSLHCANGVDLYEGTGYNSGDMSVCKKYLEASKERQYKNKKSYKGLKIFLLLLLTVSSVGGFLFGSYTYYLRHRNSELTRPRPSDNNSFVQMDDDNYASMPSARID